MFNTGTFIRVTAIDMDGLNGRSPHPPADLSGFGQVQFLVEEASEISIYRVTMGSGRSYDLADYEMEPVQNV
jgi:hypothetical protein